MSEQPYLFDLSSRYSYSPEQQGEIEDARKKVENVVSHRDLPAGYHFFHMGTGMDSTGKIPGTHTIYLVKQDPDAPAPRFGFDPIHQVGHISWNPNNGQIHDFRIDRPHRGVTPHLLKEAHDWADKEGVDGPTKSHDLTGDSLRIARNLVPSFIPPNATVSGFPARLVGAPGQLEIHSLIEKANELHARTLQENGGQESPSSALIDHLKTAKSHHAHQAYPLVTRHLESAFNIADSLGGSSPRIKDEGLKQDWADFAGRLKSHVWGS